MRQSVEIISEFLDNLTRSGSFLFRVIVAVSQFFFKNEIWFGVLIFIGALIGFLYWLFIGNLLYIGGCRFFMESSQYSKTPVSRLLYLYKIREVRKPAYVMFRRALSVSLWSLTIVGGIVKYYTYRLVPFILAENPDLDYRTAFKLSQDMMYGQKWKVFVLDLSLIHWRLLNLITAGLFGIVFFNPYKTSIDAELFKVLRDKILLEDRKTASLLKDDLLYPEVSDEKVYPVEQYFLKEQENRKWLLVDYHQTYAGIDLVLLFFVLCLVGWMWETGRELFLRGSFVNRGFLLGPWLPIYGSGGILFLLLLKKTLDKPLKSFAMVIIVSAAMEYVTSYVLELIFQTRWWDYSDRILNLHGRICIEGLLLFGVGGCIFAYYAAPLLNNLLSKIPVRTKTIISTILIVMFIVDLIHAFYVPNKGPGISNEMALSLNALIKL